MIERGVPMTPNARGAESRAPRRFLFQPVDVLTLLFAGSLVVAGLLRFGAVPSRIVLLKLLLVALAPIGIAALRARSPRPGSFPDIVCDFYVVAAIVVTFDSLGPLITAIHPRDYDASLIAFDRWLFGTDPTVALEPFATPFLSDVLIVCYALYYFHPIVLGAFIYRDQVKGVRREYARYAFTIVAVYYVSYVGYFAVPAIGPRFTVTHRAPLPRGAVGTAIDSTLDHLEKNKRDCFPSGHTMVVTAVLMEGWRRSRRTFLGFLPFALGLVAATVYGRYHYVADVLAGLLLTFLVVPLARRVAIAYEAPTGLPTSR
jgi:membrane-associated phospholipid phosphatase